MPDNFAYIGLKIIVFMGYQRFNCLYFLSVFILVYILVFLFSFSKRLVFAIKYRECCACLYTCQIPLKVAPYTLVQYLYRSVSNFRRPANVLKYSDHEK